MELQTRLAGRYWGTTRYMRFGNGVQDMWIVEDDQSIDDIEMTLTWTDPDGRIKTKRFRTERGLLRVAARVANVPVRALRIHHPRDSE